MKCKGMLLGFPGSDYLVGGYFFYTRGRGEHRIDGRVVR